MKTKFIALFCATFLLLTVVDMIIPRSEANIFDNVIRLHILADDNGEEAQSVKLKVRDAILDECGDVFTDESDVFAASRTVEANIDRMTDVANRVLAENGMDYTATAEFGYESYPTRVYDNMTLPAGNYRSLRIKLGSAEGKNWWCVLFPPLCTEAASSDDFSSANINKNDTPVFTNKKYVFRFKILEWFR